MKRYLMTQSLLSSWNYLYSCYEGQEENALEDFMRTLRREPSVPNEAMQSGIDFEREVTKAVARLPRVPHKNWEDGIKAVATVLNGAQMQVKASRNIEVGGTNFLLYGILDALKAGIIYDVKFTVKSLASGSSSYAPGKYLDGAQHSAYLAIVPEAYEFHYLVSDGKDLCTEIYRRSETRPIEEIIAEFMDSIASMDLLPLYQEKWLAK